LLLTAPTPWAASPAKRCAVLVQIGAARFIRECGADLRDAYWAAHRAPQGVHQNIARGPQQGFDASECAGTGFAAPMASAGHTLRHSNTSPLVMLNASFAACGASTIWALARFMLAAGWVDDYQVHYECIGVLPAALLYALRVINECKCLVGRLGNHPDLPRALLYAR
jgi:hypothetical protein